MSKCNCEDHPCCGCHLEESDSQCDFSSNYLDELSSKDPELFEMILDMED